MLTFIDDSLDVHLDCLSRMEDQDRVSQASSSATVSFLPIRDKVNHIFLHKHR